MSEKEKHTYESQMKINPGLRLVAKAPQSRQLEEFYQSIKVDPAQVEKIDLLNRLIKRLKAL